MYVLNGKKPVPCYDYEEYLKIFSNDNVRYVGSTKKGDTHVSTVFLACDYSFSDDSTPILFETMIFGGERDQEIWRYATWDEAEKGHRKVCVEIWGEEYENI